MLTYAEAAAALGKRDRKKLAGNTYLERDGCDYAVTYHGHPVVRIHPDGTYTLDSHGYSRSPTTRGRINRYGPVRLYQRKYVVYAGVPPFDTEFKDGMRVRADGSLVPDTTFPPEHWSSLTRAEYRALAEQLTVADDATYLVLADYCDEHDWPEQAERLRGSILRRDKVVYTLEALPEHMRPEDSFQFHVNIDFAYDALASGNLWGWCRACVTAAYDGVVRRDYLGGCSYRSEEDFRASGYYDDLKAQAFADLCRALDVRRREGWLCGL